MFHFSVDDTIDILKRLTHENYTSCFEEPVLAFFKELHLKYGLKASLYCFYENDEGFNLSMCTDKFKNEFYENSDWLSFGFHAKNRKSDYSGYSGCDFLREVKLVYDNLYEIVSKKAITFNVRLGFGKGNEECIKAFKENYPSFEILYGVDDKRIEYHLTEKENDILLNEGEYYHEATGITVKLSEPRLEKQPLTEDYLKGLKENEAYIFFTHEVHLEREEIKEKLVRLCEFSNGFTL